MSTAIKTDERRRSARRASSVQAFIISPTAIRKSERKEVLAVNISRHGVAFDFAQPLALQTYWKLDVDMGTQRLNCEICIVSCRPMDGGLFQIGAEFC